MAPVRAKPPARDFVRAREPKENDLLSFSFQYFESAHKTFKLGNCQKNFFQALVSRMKAYSALTPRELIHDQSDGTRCHQIEWDGTCAKKGFMCLRNPQLRDMVPYQVSIGGKKRAHGFFVGNCFYVVWLDPDHLLYGD